MLRLDRAVIRQGGFVLRADLEIAAGARVAVIGPSGAGKSSLLGALAGFVELESGRVLWQGRDLAGTPPGERPMSILFQDNNLFPHLTAARNVGLGLDPGLRLSADERRAVEDALGRVGLAGMGDRLPAALSGGEQGRIALARALVRDRPLLLMDEPFAALGPALRAEMFALVTGLAANRGATLLVVTHDPRDAVRLGGETVFVSDGVAHAPRDTRRLFDDPPEALAAYLD